MPLFDYFSDELLSLASSNLNKNLTFKELHEDLVVDLIHAVRLIVLITHISNLLKDVQIE